MSNLQLQTVGTKILGLNTKDLIKGRPSLGLSGARLFETLGSGSAFVFSRLRAWSKIEFGWITPETIESGAKIALPITLQPLESDFGTRAIVLSISDTRSYVIEVRRQIGYDKNLPNEGVLVYLVNLKGEWRWPGTSY